MHIRNVYSSAACNGTPESLDWGPNNLIVYAASNAAIVYAPQQSRCVRTVVQHTARVNTVKWIRNHDANSQQSTAFITGSDDRFCKLHLFRNGDGDLDIHEPATTITLAGHEGGVKTVDTLQSQNGTILVATSSSDATLKLWQVPAAESQCDTTIECYQTIMFPMELCLAVRLASVPGTVDGVLLAVGVGDTVSIYQNHIDDCADEFRLQQTLCGHEDWVRGLDIVLCPFTAKLLLASSAQDSFIRVWQQSDSSSNGNVTFALDSVLSGHDGWVYSIQWSRIAGAADRGLQLLSSSMDKTMIVWRQSGDDEDGIWTEHMRFGDIGGHFLGFFGARIEPTARQALLGHGHHGSFHLWQQTETRIDSDYDDDDNIGDWRPHVMGLGGHFGEARDLAWEPLSGRFLLSVAADQTTRVHAPCPFQMDGVEPTNTNMPVWHEVARPQVHGYDMQTVAMLGRYRFASGAEEKIVRTFQAPSAFVRCLRKLCDAVGEIRVKDDDEGDAILKCK